jgi:transcriptional regulator with XRE-family HTH domain
MGFGMSAEQRAADARVEEEMLALVTQVTNEITVHLRERGLARADLAARMGVSPGRVSQILGGGENLTLRTLAMLSVALDGRFAVELDALKPSDSFSSSGSAPAWDEAGPAGHSLALSRARHLGTARNGSAAGLPDDGRLRRRAG